MPEPVSIRTARPDDAAAVARIFNQAVAERVATFETRELRTAGARDRIRAAPLTLIAEDGAGTVHGFARVSPYCDPHPYYAGVGEATLYVERSRRRTGSGRLLLEALAIEAPAHGFYKLLGKIFTTNRASIALVGACGWSEVGVHRRHGRLDGQWKDVLVVELLIGEAAAKRD